MTFLKARGWAGYIFAAGASPRASTKEVAMLPSCTVHGGQYDANYVTFEWTLQAAYVADTIWGVLLDPACIAAVVTSFAAVVTFIAAVMSLLPLESYLSPLS